MTEKMLAAVALAILGVMDTGGMIVLSCMEKEIPAVLVQTSGIVIGGLVVLAGINGVKNGLRKINGGG
jgi:hypothetical protein